MFLKNVFSLNKIVFNSRILPSIYSRQLGHTIVTKNRDNGSTPAVNEDRYRTKFMSDKEFRLNVLQNIFVLSQNVLKAKQRLNQLIEDKDLQTIYDTIEANVENLKDPELINCLHSFLTMNLDPNSRIIQSLENEILWRSKKLSLKDILKCLTFQVRYQTTEQQIKVVKELIINLVLKLDNANNEDDVIQMLTLWRSLTPEIIHKVEMTSLEMIGRRDEKAFKLKTLSYILVLLSQMNRRTKPLIDAVVKRFTYSPIDANDCEERHLIQMISSLNQLNYSDIHFLQKSCDILCNKNFLNTVRASDRRDLLVAVSQTNWCYPRLLDQYVEKMMETNNDFSTQDFLVLVTSFARLHWRSPYLDSIFNHYLIPYVKREDLDCDSWLLYVWSLSILGCVPLNYINSVMNNEFYNEITSKTSNEFKKNIIHLKLRNIKAVAEIEMNEVIDFEPILTKNYELNRKEGSVESLKKSILQMLSTFVPNITSNVLTPFGFAIDAEFITNKYNDSLPPKEYGILGADTSNRVQPLPEGYERCALMCYGFNDTLLGQSSLIGIHELSVRLLRRLGYKVVLVNRKQFNCNSINSQNIEKLKSIKKVMSIQIQIVGQWEDTFGKAGPHKCLVSALTH